MLWTAGHRSVYDTQWSPLWNSNRFEKLLNKIKTIVQPSITSASAMPNHILNGIYNNNNNNQNKNKDMSVFEDNHPIRSSYFSSTIGNSRRPLGHLLKNIVGTSDSRSDGRLDGRLTLLSMWYNLFIYFIYL
jgi:hypothetical protein